MSPAPRWEPPPEGHEGAQSEAQCGCPALLGPRFRLGREQSTARAKSTLLAPPQRPLEPGAPAGGPPVSKPGSGGGEERETSLRALPEQLESWAGSRGQAPVGAAAWTPFPAPGEKCNVLFMSLRAPAARSRTENP